VCVAESIDVATCRYDDSYNVSRASNGYISSSALSLPGLPAVCDDTRRPWIISGQHGQRINVTLVNFTPLTRNQLQLTTGQTHIADALRQRHAVCACPCTLRWLGSKSSVV